MWELHGYQGNRAQSKKINSPSISFRNFLIENQSFTSFPQCEWRSRHNQYRGSCVLQATCILGVGFLAPGHNQYRNKCHLIPPSCSWGLPWVGLPRGVSFDSQEKMCPSIAWHRARFARPFQTHRCEGEAAQAVHITDQPGHSVLLAALPACRSALNVHFTS